MTEGQKFGAKLRDLRKKSGMTLRELADKVGIDFTYLSKIENGALPPPSEKVIRKLAEVFNYEQDELLALGGIIPADIAEILKDRQAREQLRAEQIKRAKAAARKPFSLSKFSPPLKGIYRLAVPVFLVVVVALSLWFAAPTKALDITYSALPTGVLGSSYTFTVTVTIDALEHLPLQNIDVIIYNVADPIAHRATLAGMPLATSASTLHNPVEGVTSGTATVAALADAHWGYTASAAGYVVWQGQGYTFVPSPSGGYGYQGYGTGATSIVYTITWVPPVTWPQGNYQIDTVLTTATYNPGSGTTFTKTSSSFTLGTGGGGIAPTTTPGTTSLTGKINAAGMFTEAVIASSADSLVSLTIAQGVVGLTSTGTPLTEITIVPMASPPAPPAQSNVIGLTYNFGPSGATFNPPITVTFTYDPLAVPTGVNPADLVIAYYDTATGTWIELTNIVVNTTTHQITAQVSHFTAFEVIAYTAPASFTASSLSITPATVNAGATSTIKVTVANNGDLSGSFDVVLKVNNVVTETKSVTLDGNSSTDVSFSLTQATPGSYTINVNGLTGVLTVNAAPTTTPPTTTPPTTTPPTTTPPTTVPTTTPPTTTPPTTTLADGGGISWWLIVIIVVVVIVIALIIWMVIARRRS